MVPPIPMTARRMMQLASSPGSGKLRARSPAAVEPGRVAREAAGLCRLADEHVGGPGIDFGSIARGVHQQLVRVGERPCAERDHASQARGARALTGLVDAGRCALDQRQRIGGAAGVPGGVGRRDEASVRARPARGSARPRASSAAWAAASPARSRARAAICVEVAGELLVGLDRRRRRVPRAAVGLRRRTGPLPAQGGPAGAGRASRRPPPPSARAGGRRRCALDSGARALRSAACEVVPCAPAPRGRARSAERSRAPAPQQQHRGVRSGGIGRDRGKAASAPRAIGSGSGSGAPPRAWPIERRGELRQGQGVAPVAAARPGSDAADGTASLQCSISSSAALVEAPELEPRTPGGERAAVAAVAPRRRPARRPRPRAGGRRTAARPARRRPTIARRPRSRAELALGSVASRSSTAAAIRNRSGTAPGLDQAERRGERLPARRLSPHPCGRAAARALMSPAKAISDADSRPSARSVRMPSPRPREVVEQRPIARRPRRGRRVRCSFRRERLRRHPRDGRVRRRGRRSHP